MYYVRKKKRFPLPFVFFFFPGWRIMWTTRQSFPYWYFQRVSITMCLALRHQRKESASVDVLTLCPLAMWTRSCDRWARVWDLHNSVLFILLICLFFFAGTCINNTSVMMFKKGSFEIGATIYPVAMKVIHFCMSVKLHSSFRCIHSKK